MIRIVLVSLFLGLLSGTASATEAGWALLRNGGQVVLMRHAYAAGGADAAQVDLENCSTQRVLSDRGRQQARRIGSLFATRAERVDHVYTSRYCRARDTANLAFRSSEDLPALDPIDDPEAPGTSAAETLADEIKTLMRSFSGSGNMVLVTHDSVIRALTGSGAREGEAVILRLDGETLRVAGRIIFN